MTFFTKKVGLHLLLLSLPVFTIIAQNNNILITGKIVCNKEPVPFANIILKNTGIGTASNIDGNFIFSIPAIFSSKSIIISSIGYSSQEIDLSKTDVSNELIINLKESVNEINEIVVKQLDATHIVKQALKNLKKNFESDPHRVDAFYRTTFQENGKFTRLLEAAVFINDKNGSLHGQRDIDVREIRMSNDFRKDKWKTFDGYLAHLVRNHPVYSHYLNFMKPWMLKDFACDIENAKFQDNRLYYVIKLKSLKNQRSTAYDVVMTIRENDFAIAAIKILWKPELSNNFSWAWEQRDTAKFVCHWQESDYSYQEFEGKFYLKSAKWHRKGKVININTKKTIFDTESLDELLVTNIEKGDFENNDNLTDNDIFELARTMKYHPTFWKQYNRPADSEHFKLAKSEMEKVEDLEHQFPKNGLK